MRRLFMPLAVTAVLLVRPSIAQPVAPVPDTSVFAPRALDALPPPTPVAPAAMPLVVQPPRTFAPPSPAPDVGTITAVPLPPPGTEPAPSPMPGIFQPAAPTAAAPGPAINAPPGGTAAATPLAPIPLAPIPLAPIPLTLPPLGTDSAKSGTQAAKSPAAPIVSARLPTPALSPEASPTDFLRAARGAVAAGRNGEARSALEMAQTRLLDRSVDAGKENVPSTNLAVKQISEAIDALVSNDRMTCPRYIEFAAQTIGSPLD
jgi:hypothetical protein